MDYLIAIWPNSTPTGHSSQQQCWPNSSVAQQLVHLTYGGQPNGWPWFQYPQNSEPTTLPQAYYEPKRECKVKQNVNLVKEKLEVKDSVTGGVLPSPEKTCLELRRPRTLEEGWKKKPKQLIASLKCKILKIQKFKSFRMRHGGAMIFWKEKNEKNIVWKNWRRKRGSDFGFVWNLLKSNLVVLFYVVIFSLFLFLFH